MAVITWTLKNTGTKTQIFSASRVDSNPQRSEISRHGLRWVDGKGYRCRSNKWQDVFLSTKTPPTGLMMMSMMKFPLFRSQVGIFPQYVSVTVAAARLLGQAARKSFQCDLGALCSCLHGAVP